MEEKDVAKQWGTEEEYYKYKEEFFKQHEGADTQVYDNESKCLIKVEYYFRPYQVAIENQELKDKIAEANQKR